MQWSSIFVGHHRFRWDRMLRCTGNDDVAREEINFRIERKTACMCVCVYYEWYGRRQWKMPLQWEKKPFPECYPPHSIQTPVIYYDYIIVQIVHTCPNKIGRCGCINDTKLFSMEICVLFVSFSVNFMSRKLDKIIIIVDRPMFSYRIGAKRWKMVCSMSM